MSKSTRGSGPFNKFDLSEWSDTVPCLFLRNFLVIDQFDTVTFYFYISPYLCVFLPFASSFSTDLSSSSPSPPFFSFSSSFSSLCWIRLSIPGRASNSQFRNPDRRFPLMEMGVRNRGRATRINIARLWSWKVIIELDKKRRRNQSDKEGNFWRGRVSGENTQKRGGAH